MPIPQVNDRIKEAPVVVLRAVFAGIGQLLLTADKVRTRATEQAGTLDRPAGPGLASQPPSWSVAPAKTAPITNAATTTKPAPAAKAATTTKPAPAAKATASTKPAPGAKSASATKPAATTKPAPAAKAAAATKPAPAVKPATTKPASPTKPAPATKDASPAKTAKPAPAAKAAPTAKPGSAATAARRDKSTSAAAPAVEAPPLPGYDDLSLPSLRARLRTLDASALTAMLAYEKAHARRDDVITMLERRMAKITTE